MTRAACILSGAALFALGMAFHEYLRPMARREPRRPAQREWLTGWTDSSRQWSDSGWYIAIDDWATDPRTAELATGGGQEGAGR